MQFKMINVCSWNIPGLSDPIKRAAVITAVTALQASVVCLQETHLTKETFKKEKLSDSISLSI